MMLPTFLLLSAAAMPALSLTTPLISRTVPETKNVNISFDSFNAFLAPAINYPVNVPNDAQGNDEGINFVSFAYANSQSIPIVNSLGGVRPQSAPNRATTNYRVEILNALATFNPNGTEPPALTIRYPGSKYKSFTLEEMYIDCVTSLLVKGPVTTTAVGCGVTFTAMKNGAFIASQTFNYAPKTPLNPLDTEVMQRIVFPKTFADVTDVLVTLTNAITNINIVDRTLVAVQIDNVIARLTGIL